MPSGFRSIGRLVAVQLRERAPCAPLLARPSAHKMKVKWAMSCCHYPGLSNRRKKKVVMRSTVNNFFLR